MYSQKHMPKFSKIFYRIMKQNAIDVFELFICLIDFSIKL